MDLTRILAAYSSIELRCDQYFSPDAAPPEEYLGPSLLVVIFAGQLWCCADNQTKLVKLSGIDIGMFLDAAQAAIQEGSLEPGADTATGRTITRLSLRLEDAERRQSTAVATINHHAPRELGPAWSRMLRLLRDVTRTLSAEASLAWYTALRWMQPVELGDDWQTGNPIPLPSFFTSFYVAEPLYLRIGQPPAISRLYWLDPFAARLEEVSPGGDSFEAPFQPKEWSLFPCGGASFYYKTTWDRAKALVSIQIHDSERWSYVQRDLS